MHELHGERLRPNPAAMFKEDGAPFHCAPRKAGHLKASGQGNDSLWLEF